MGAEGRKLVLIGAGSAVFSRSLLADLILDRDCPIREVVLVDINPDAVQTVTALGRRMAAGRRDELQLSGTVDRREALVDADYVATTFAVGGRAGRQADVRIPRRHGLYLPVGDTVGPGGLARVLRHVPLMTEIASDLAELCPNAWLLNFANPLSCIVRAATAVHPRTIGLCHGLPERARRLCRWAGVSHEGWDLDCAGVNHCTWVTHLVAEGVDVLAKAREGLATGDVEPWLAEQPFTMELLQTYGLFVVPGDRHVIEFYPQYFRQGYGGQRPGIDVWNVDAELSSQVERIEQMRAEAEGRIPLDESFLQRRAGDHESLVGIVSAIDSNSGARFTANVPNHGAVPQLPDEAILELPLEFRRDGCRSLAQHELPPGIVAHQTQRCLQQELAYQAALSGDRKLALQALLEDGWVGGVAAAGRLLDDLLEAHREHLPRFYG